MKGLFKKSLALFIAFAMIFTCAPYSLARDEASVQPQSTTGFSSGTGLNPIVQSFSEEDKNSYSIVSVEINGKSATVELNNKAACTIVVAVYEEGSTHMLGCAVEDIEASAGTVTATIDVDTLPEYYIAKAYLLNSGYTSLSGEEYLLCEPYTYIGKTKAYLEFLAKEPEDFEGEEIIVFDDEKDRTDFAVFTDDVILSDDSGKIDFTYDEETSVYTFISAPDDLASLNPGDVYYYKYGENTNEFLLLKVESVTVSGEEIIVKTDTNFALGEAFDFLRIDTEADFSALEDGFLFGDGYTKIKENSSDITLNGDIFDQPEVNVYSTTLELDYTLGSTAGGALKASLSATLGFEAKASVKLYYDINIGKDFYEFKSTNSFEFTLSGLEVTGEISLPKDKFTMETPTPVPIGPLNLYISFAPVIEFNGSFSGSASYKSEIIVTADNENGLNKSVEENSDFKPDFKTKFTVKIGLEVGVKYGWSESVNLKMTIGAGVKFTGDPEIVGLTDAQHHSCDICVDGEANLYVNGSLSFNIKIWPDVIDFSWPFVSLTHNSHLFDFYISYKDNEFKFGKGACPNLRYKTVINVFNEKGEDIPGATVSCPSGVCDANGDGNYNETADTTDSNGEVVFYLKKGNHEITVKKKDYKDATTTVNIIANPKYINVKLLEIPLYKITVTVKDQYGKPVNGATFYSETAYYDVDGDGVNENTSATTNSSGIAVLEFRSGAHTVTTSCKGYKTKTQQITVSDADKSLSVTLEQYHKLTVSVADEEGNAISGANITLTGDTDGDGIKEDYVSISSSSGAVTVNLLPASYEIKVTKDKYKPYSNSLVLNRDTSHSVTLKTNQLNVGDIVEFGSYPQSEVTDSSTLAALNSLPLNWISYEYYSGTGSYADGQMKPGNWMKYVDVEYKGQKYRGVTFSSYRPYETGGKNSNTNTYQIFNGYYTDNIYWFKFEPIQWIVLDPNDGLIFCQSVIDGQAYSNVLCYNFNLSISLCFNSTSCTNYASDYETSSIRKWLNNDFYNIAFTSAEKAQINTTTLDNSCYSSSYPQYDSNTTLDKIFLLSYKEVQNSSYGFNVGTDSTPTRSANITAYAKSQGVYVYSSYTTSSWLLRTSGNSSQHICCVSDLGSISNSIYYAGHLQGIRPALKLNSNSDVLKSYISNSVAEPVIQLNSDSQADSSQNEQGGKISFVKDDCVPNQEYVILNVTSYGSDFKLDSDNLYYIDTVTADSEGLVTVDFTQKQPAKNSTTLLIGDFGNGIETMILKYEATITPPSTATVNYGETLVLSVEEAVLPEGYAIEWTVDGSGFGKVVSEDGLECRLTSVANGTATVTAKIIDENGEAIVDAEGNEISDSITLTSKAGFFQKLISFFKNLFRINRIIY